MRLAAELIFQLSLLLLAGLLCGQAAKRLGLPRLVGELAAGVALGPSLLASVAPHVYSEIFPATLRMTGMRNGIIQFGLLIFLFTVGADTDLPRMRRLGVRIVWTSLGGMLLPFFLGMAGVALFPSAWQMPPHVNRLLLGLFMGTTLSISALPVIAKILRDLNLLNTDVGIVVMSAATLDDLAGWSLFAVILLCLGPNGGSPIGVSPGAIFGAFIGGIAFARIRPPHPTIYFGANEVFAPLYFVSVGLQANFVRNLDPALVGLILILASLGKIAGATVGARMGGTPLKQALAIGFGLNARGAMGIILSTVALTDGLIAPSTFVAIVTMSLVTSLISGPVMQKLMRTE